ncbi:XRE family transcriptional regulator [Bordetella trematum]|uniref:DNA-binding protein n=1 Tax=Bordetella trematum TaxID=123899 RepID=A0A157RL77_9BORD|nr:cupin domain-containing protein [Bordetella trematum]AUL49297.1 XRE family transcriptional regulator [Bordetella trematum]AZR96268.1 XRE family transcriptional regulator [Bordetella trematum]NNH18222.1 cupin domain-containing protein [Bordetella trematum]QIM70183.1 cupin domain-containing protein [Bordetella trematum]SAI49803.1 DNA-binding protein [Bordetella trematum]
MPRIGADLRELRRRRGLGIREVAARSGVSHASISLIERDKISPSLDTLAAVLDALGSTIVGFFSNSRLLVAESPFYGPDELPEIGNANAISYRMIGSRYANRAMLMMREHYAPGADTGELFSHNAQEAGLVTQGAVEVTVGDKIRVLQAGEAYYFDSRVPHRFRNAHDGPSEIVSAVTPPTY